MAKVGAKILSQPSEYRGQVIELTGSCSISIYDLAQEYSTALGSPVKYVDILLETWINEEFEKSGIREHAYHHIVTMAKLHAAGRYDRCTNSIAEILGRPATSMLDTIKSSPSQFPCPGAY
jgi:hypothetical protein